MYFFGDTFSKIPNAFSLQVYKARFSTFDVAVKKLHGYLSALDESSKVDFMAEVWRQKMELNFFFFLNKLHL